MRLILSFREIEEREANLVGGKAVALSRLSRRGSTFRRGNGSLSSWTERASPSYGGRRSGTSPSGSGTSFSTPRFPPT